MTGDGKGWYELCRCPGEEEGTRRVCPRHDVRPNATSSVVLMSVSSEQHAQAVSVHLSAASSPHSANELEVRRGGCPFVI
jgi:hypothetical protein